MNFDAPMLPKSDLTALQELEFISNASAPKTLYSKPLRIKSDITNEMIDDYRHEQMMEKRVVPTSYMVMLEEYTPLHHVLSPEQLEKMITIDKPDIVDKINFIEDTIRSIPIDDIEIDKQFNKEMEELDTYLDSPSIEKEKKELTKNYTTDKQNIIKRLEQARFDKETLQSRLKDIDILRNENIRNVNENLAERLKITKLNEAQVKQYEDELKLLNIGLQLGKQENETEREYLERLEKMNGMRYDINSEDQALLYNIKKFKRNLKELYSMPESKLEKLIKYLKKGEKIYEINKKWFYIKNEFIKLFGKYPYFEKPDEELLDFFLNTLAKSEGMETEDENKTFAVTSVLSEVDDRLKEAQAKRGRSTGLLSKQELLNRYRGLTGKKTFQGSSLELAKEITKLMRKPPINIYEIEQPISEIKKPISKIKTILSKLEPIQETKEEFEKPKSKRTVKKEMASPLISSPKKGMGIQGEFFEKFVPFGRVIISPSQLFYHHVLRIRESNKHSITGMPDIKISEDFVNILMKILKEGQPTTTELKTLDDKERNMYDALLHKAHLHKELPNTTDQSIPQLKHRLELVSGEIVAGNDNPVLKKELGHIISQMVSMRIISAKDGKQFINEHR